MIAANIAQSIIGWAGGLLLVVLFIAWRGGMRTSRAIGAAAVILLPCWGLYALFGAVA
jgi:hypothetical protein